MEMNRFIFKTILMALFLGFGFTSLVNAQGSLMRRLQQKTEEKIIEEIFKEPENEKSPDRTTPGTERSPQTRNQRGGGLDQEVPDVSKSITDADLAFNAGKYVEAKSSVRNALWGIELEIGQNVLNSLPQSVGQLQSDKNDDRVTSTGIGFVGLVIERTYRGKDDMVLSASVGSDSAILGLAGLYMTEGLYMQSSDQTDQKQIRFQDHRATIQYTDYDGYTLSIPFGQSSLFLVKGVNYDSESQFLTAANSFDISKIKKELGEQ
jgi:hypothetical protein